MNSKIDVGFLLTEKDRVINELKKQHLKSITLDAVSVLIYEIIKKYNNMNSQKEENKNATVEEIIDTIYQEIENSGDSYYVTKENQEFSADVVYVKEWLDDYKEVLRKRYS